MASFLSPRREMLTLPIRERDETRRSLRFITSLSLSHYERVSIYLSSRRERDETALSHSVPSPPFGLRPWAVISKPAVFASLSRVLSNPLRGFDPSAYETKSEALRLRFLFQGERGIRTLGPVTDSGFRDRPIRPLWHLSEVCTI